MGTPWPCFRSEPGARAEWREGVQGGFPTAISSLGLDAHPNPWPVVSQYCWDTPPLTQMHGFDKVSVCTIEPIT